MNNAHMRSLDNMACQWVRTCLPVIYYHKVQHLFIECRIKRLAINELQHLFNCHNIKHKHQFEKRKH